MLPLSWVLVLVLIVVGGVAFDLAATNLMVITWKAIHGDPAHGRPRLYRAWWLLAVVLFTKNLLSGPLAKWAGGGGHEVGDRFPWAHPAPEAWSIAGKFAVDAVIMAIGVTMWVCWPAIQQFKETFGKAEPTLAGRAAGRAGAGFAGGFVCTMSVGLHTQYTTDNAVQSVFLLITTFFLLDFLLSRRIRELAYPREPRQQATLRRLTHREVLRRGVLLGICNSLAVVIMLLDGRAQITGSAGPIIGFMITAMLIEMIRTATADRAGALTRPAAGSDFFDRIARLDNVLGWDLADVDDSDGDYALSASQLERALADTGLTASQIRAGFAELAAAGRIVVDTERPGLDYTTWILEDGFPRRVYTFRGRRKRN
ncbi:hypothetical protein [Nocardia thraciensis]